MTEEERNLKFASSENPSYRLAGKILPALIEEGLSYEDTKDALIIAQSLLDEFTYPSFR